MQSLVSLAWTHALDASPEFLYEALCEAIGKQLGEFPMEEYRMTESMITTLIREVRARGYSTSSFLRRFGAKFHPGLGLLAVVASLAFATASHATNLDLEIVKSHAVATFTPGGNVIYTIVVTNHGPLDGTSGAQHSHVFDPAVPGITKTGTPTCAAASGAQCPTGLTNAQFESSTGVSIPGIPNGGKLTFTIFATINANVACGAAVTNTATVAVASNLHETNAGNNTWSDTFTVVCAKLTVKKSVPVGPNDGRFDLRIDGSIAGTGTNVGNAGTTGLQTVTIGTHTVGETADTSTVPSSSLTKYITTISCQNGTQSPFTPAVSSGSTASQPTWNVPVAANDNIVCTITNTRKSATLKLRKTWVNATTGETATVTSSGFTNNATSGLSTSTGNNTTTGSTVTVYAGESGTISETLSNPGKYTATLACTGNGTALSGNTLTINAVDTAIVCTETNTKIPLPTLNKSFSPNTFADGGSTTLTFTISNPAGSPAVNVGFKDTLPTGLLVAASPAKGGTCNAAASTTAVAGTNTITVANLAVPAGAASCTVTVGVTNKAGSFNSSCANNPVTFTNAGANNTTGTNNISLLSNVIDAITQSCVTVTPKPSLNKAFSPNTFAIGGFTTLTFTVSNPAGSPAVNVGFTDNLPSGLQVATPAAVGGTCTNAIAATTAAGTTITVANLAIPAGAASCTVMVNVTNKAGQVNDICTNNPAAFTNTGPANVSNLQNVNDAIAPSCVIVKPLTPTLNKSFSPNTFLVGGFTTLTFTVNNPALNPALANVGFTDNLPAGLQVATPAAVGGTCANAIAATTAAGTTITVANLAIPAGAASCTVTVNVTNKAGQINDICSNNPAAFTNTGPANVSNLQNVNDAISPSCVIVKPLTPSLNKAFSPNSFSIGGFTTLTFTVSNPALNPALSNVGFTDNLPSGLQVHSPTVKGGTCANASAATTAVAGATTITVASLQIPAGGATGSSCTVTVRVTNKLGLVNPSCANNPVAFTNAGVINTTGTNNISGLQNVNDAITQSCVTVTPLKPHLNKAFDPEQIHDGGTSTLTFDITNPAANNPAQQVTFTDTLPTKLQIAAVPNVVKGPGCGSGSVIALAGQNSITITNLTVLASTAVPKTCSVSVNVTNVPGQLGTCPDSNLTNTSANISNITNLVNSVQPSCLTVNFLSFAISKVASARIVRPNSPLSFTITVFNTGTGSADGSLLSDAVISGYTATSIACTAATGGAVCPSPANVTLAKLQGAGIALPTFPAGSSVKFLLHGTFTLAVGQITNTAVLLPPGGPPINGHDSTSTAPGGVVLADPPMKIPTMDLGNLFALMLLLAFAGGLFIRRGRR
jgi:mucin-19